MTDEHTKRVIQYKDNAETRQTGFSNFISEMALFCMLTTKMNMRLDFTFVQFLLCSGCVRSLPKRCENAHPRNNNMNVIRAFSVVVY